jgi:hypothetical protein
MVKSVIILKDIFKILGLIPSKPLDLWIFNFKSSVSTSSGSIQVYENVFSSQSLELTQLSNFSVDAFKLEFLMMRSATDEKWLLKLLQISSILSHFLPSIFKHFIWHFDTEFMSFKCFHNSPTLLPDLIASEKIISFTGSIGWCQFVSIFFEILGIFYTMIIIPLLT